MFHRAIDTDGFTKRSRSERMSSRTGVREQAPQPLKQPVAPDEDVDIWREFDQVPALSSRVDLQTKADNAKKDMKGVFIGTLEACFESLEVYPQYAAFSADLNFTNVPFDVVGITCSGIADVCGESKLLTYTQGRTDLIPLALDLHAEPGTAVINSFRGTINLRDGQASDAFENFYLTDITLTTSRGTTITYSFKPPGIRDIYENAQLAKSYRPDVDVAIRINDVSANRFLNSERSTDNRGPSGQSL